MRGLHLNGTLDGTKVVKTAVHMGMPFSTRRIILDCELEVVFLLPGHSSLYEFLCRRNLVFKPSYVLCLAYDRESFLLQFRL